MNNRFDREKFISVRRCLAVATGFLTLLGGTLVTKGIHGLVGIGSGLLEFVASAGLVSGDAMSLVVIALVGVVLISRRDLPL